MKPALLVIDVQNAFFDISPTTAQSLNDAIETINIAIKLFHKKSLPIICIQHIDEDDKLFPGQAEFDLPDTLDIESTDTIIHKSYSNGFKKTNLEKNLKEMEIDTIIISGFCAEYCILSTYRGAQDKDLTPVILRNSLASTTPKNIKFVENISDIISFRALEKVLS